MDLVRFQNNIKRIINCFKDIKYVYNESAPVLSREQYAAINIGAINSEQNGYYAIVLKQNLIKRMLQVD